MSTATLAWTRIGTINDIPVQGARRVILGDMKIAVFRTTANKVFALEDKCPHKNGPLSEGIVHDGCVTCPLHNWVIRLEDGTAQGADEGKTRTFPVKIDGQDILLNLENYS